MRKRVLFYCQPVLGIGHFIRSREIVRQLRDFDVCFVNGGEIAPGLTLPGEIELVNLPALKSDAEFQELYHDGSERAMEEVKAQRKRQLLELYDRVQPDLLIIELFPFGRLKFDFELIPLLEKARASQHTKIVCSLRDILVSKRAQAQFEEDACQRMNQYFDLLLVHSDPSFQRLEETFPRVHDIHCEIRYTGFVAQSEQAADDELHRVSQQAANIIVSIGGGRVGYELIECAIAAASLLDSSHRMHILTGPHLPEEQFQKLQQIIAARPLISIERFTPNLTELLRQADLSISLAGYNTCMDILSSGVRAIVYPFTGNNNQEQTIRAGKLERLGLLTMIEAHELTPQRLAALIEQKLQTPAPAVSFALKMDGALETARILSELTKV